MPCVAFGSYAGVASLLWKAWQCCRGIGGKFAMESVASLAWNWWQLSYGIGGNFRTEYAHLRVDAIPLGDRIPFNERHRCLLPGVQCDDFAAPAAYAVPVIVGIHHPILGRRQPIVRNGPRLSRLTLLEHAGGACSPVVAPGDGSPAYT